ncbi:MAG: translation initiation factor [Chthoniobacteraceae bacterium]
MSRPNKDKIPTQAPAGGLFQAFAGLDIGGLPEGPAASEEAAPSRRVSKKGRVVLRRETAHRGGKTVIIVDGFADSINDAAIDALGKELRAACGCGGSVKDRSIEIQGEQVARLREILVSAGFQVAGER